MKTASAHVARHVAARASRVLASRRSLVVVTASFVAVIALVSSGTLSRAARTSPGSGQSTSKAKSVKAGMFGGARMLSSAAESRGTRARAFAPMAPLPPFFSETIATFAPDCTTPKTNFELGDTVCAKITGAPLRTPTALRSFNWANPRGYILQTQEVVANPDTNLFVLPISNTSVIDGETVDNRGTWSISNNSIGEFERQGVAYFNVSDPANVAADLAVYNFSNDPEPIIPGSNTSFFLWLSNIGPDAASDVHVTIPTPPNLTFTSTDTTSAFTCAESSGVVDCSLATWAAGGVATITLNYSVSGGAPNGVISTTANITSDTNDPHSSNDSGSAGVEIRTPGAPPATCALSCPPDITVTATSPAGAVVNFSGNVEVSGDCGAITYSPVSGSTFTIGTHSVSVTSGTGGGSCSFTVTVIDPGVSPAPTITCPLPDLTAAAASGQSEATVSVSQPAATGTGVSVSGSRSDNRDVSDDYPVGTTFINWTATDSVGRTASCVQKVIVTSVDFPTITCPSDKTFDAGGDCQKTLTAGDIGTPTVGGLSPTVSSRRSDNAPLTDPFPAGQTVITWTAENALGSASCTQVITITSSGDSTAPVLTVPPDVDVTTSTCSALIDDELGVATATDNCSTVAISRSGVPLVSCPIPGDPGRMCESFVFPVGTTDVTYTATDASGNTATGVQHVTVHETTPPVFTYVPPNVGPIYTGPTATSCGAFVSDAVIGTPLIADNCDTTVIRTGVPAGNIFPVGTTTITYKAKADLSVTATQTVTVVDNTAPVVTAPAAVTLYTGAGATSCGVTVSNLDATLGTGSATDNCPGVGPVTRSGVPAGNNFPVGTTTVTYSATDAAGNTGSATQVVTVIDNTPPVITTNGQTLSMWPPNHKYQTFLLTQFVTGASDNCGGVSINDVVIEKVTSDEIENGNGDGNTLNDIVIAADCKSVQLRAEREGNGNGRIYTITFKVTDTHGNVGRATATVVVPHNPGETAVDSGVQYTVNGTCP